MIDTLFLSSGDALYAGKDEGGGKFTGHPVKNGKITGAMKVHMNGRPLGRVLGEPLDLSSGDVIPRNTSIHLEGATVVPFGQYIDSVEALRARNKEKPVPVGADEAKAKKRAAPKAKKSKPKARPEPKTPDVEPEPAPDPAE